MSVLITVKAYGDTDAFEKATVNRADEFVAFSKKGKAAGAIHHRFGIGDGYIFVIDEWDDPAHFEAFFTDPALQQFIAECGGDTTREPEITVVRAFSAPDEF